MFFLSPGSLEYNEFWNQIDGTKSCKDRQTEEMHRAKSILKSICINPIH